MSLGVLNETKSKTEGTCVHVQLIHFAIQQKRTQHCNNCTPIKINLKRVIDPQLQCGRRNRTIRSGVLRMKSHGSDQGHSPINTSVSVVKNPPAGEETQIRSLGRRKKWIPTSVFLPGKSHGQRNLVGHSPPLAQNMRYTHHWPQHTF